MIYKISYKTLIGAKPFRIIFNKVNRFIRVSDEAKYLIFIGLEKYNAIYDRIRSFLSLKSFTYLFSYNYAKIKIDSKDE